MAVAIVIALRLVLPLSILRWPLAGGLLAMLIDAADVVLVEALAPVLGESPEFGPAYAQIDKVLDLWYLSLGARGDAALGCEPVRARRPRRCSRGDCWESCCSR